MEKKPLYLWDTLASFKNWEFVQNSWATLILLLSSLYYKTFVSKFLNLFLCVLFIRSWFVKTFIWLVAPRGAVCVCFLKGQCHDALPSTKLHPEPLSADGWCNVGTSLLLQCARTAGSRLKVLFCFLASQCGKGSSWARATTSRWTFSGCRPVVDAIVLNKLHG